MSTTAILRPSRQLHSGGRWFHGAPITHVDWDPRGRRLLSQSEGAVKLWWAATGELVGALPGIGGGAAAIGRFVFTADGRRVVGAVRDRRGRIAIHAWDVEDLSLAGELCEGEIAAEDRSRRLAVCWSSQNVVRLVELESGATIANLETTEATGMVAEYVEILAAAIHPDGSRVFLHRRNSVPEVPAPIVTETFELWDVATQKLLKRSRPANESTSACWDAAGRRIVVGGEGASIYDGETLQPLGRLDQIPGYTPRLHPLADGRIVAAHGKLARLYSADGLTPDPRYLSIAGPAIALSPDGATLLAAGAAGLLMTYDLATGATTGEAREIPQSDHFVGGIDRTVGVSRDGATLAVGMGTSIAFHDARSLELRRTVEWVRATSEDRSLFRATDRNATPDGALAATFWPYDRSRDGEPHGVLVHGPGGALTDLKLQITDGRAGPVAVSPDGVLAASGHSTFTMRLWELATGIERRSLYLAQSTEPAATIAAVAFSTDGTLVAAGDQTGAIHVWRTADGTRIVRLHAFGDAPVTSLAFGSRGRLAVGRSGQRSNLTLLDADGQRIALLVGHASDVTSLAFHPDGTRLFSAGRDRCVFAWKLP